VHVEEISPSEWEQREVYAKFGLAVYLCQCLETQLVNYVIALRAVSGDVVTRQDVDALFAELFGHTLGRNLKEGGVSSAMTMIYSTSWSRCSGCATISSIIGCGSELWIKAPARSDAQ
jgi:hypothetical protein